MAEVLDIIDPKGDFGEQLENVRNNFLTINKQSLRAGAYMLADVVVSAAQTVSSTSYVAVTGMSGSFVSSGGLVLVDASIVSLPAARYIYYVLLIDGEEKGWAFAYDNGGQVGTNAILSRWMSLTAGNHKWEVKAKVDGGSVVIGFTTNTKSTLSIIEFLRG